VVLVVDDVLMNRDIASSFLRASGHTVICVDSGQEALTAAARADFDVVLMDVRMPEMDGLEASRRIRSLEGARGQVPIVALTAQAFTDQIAECRAAGMDSHLAKPFDPATLLNAVVSAVAAGRTMAKPSGAKPSLEAAAEPSVIGTDLPVFDRIAFQRSAAFLDPPSIAGYLRTITDGCAGLLLGFDALDTPLRTTREQGGAAHALAGPAGLFGFQRLASLCLMFERTAEPGPDFMDRAAVIAGLRAAIQASIGAIQAMERQDAEISRIDAAAPVAM
jgi:CheY-like chemotaxis protein